MMLRDRRVQLAIGITVAMTVLVTVVAQDSLLLGIGLVFVMAAAQMAVLFGGHSLPKELHQARQHYRRGEFTEAVQVLEEATDLPAQGLALLGNAYRQLGQLEASEQRLRQALELDPTDRLVLYGLGRTLMVKGNYTGAVRYIKEALEHGARSTIRADLALAMHYNGTPRDQLEPVVRQASRTLKLENYRALIVSYLLYNWQDSQAQRMMHNTADGLAYWQSQARRYADTDYGQRLAADVAAIEALLNKEHLT